MTDTVRFDRLFRRVTVSATLAALAYLGFSLWVGAREVADAVARVGPASLIAALLLSLVNYGLRFARWQMYLHALGTRVAPGPSALIYLAGFAFTTTPGKAGELLRGLFLHRRGTSYLRSTAAFLSERLSDLLAVLLLALPGLWVLSPVAAVGACVFLGVGIAVAVVVSDRQLAPKLSASLMRLPGKVQAVIAHLFALVREARHCHTRGMLAAATGLSLVAWVAEAVAFAIILYRLGIQVDPSTAVFIYAASMIAGALSFLPGGLGGAEATMVGLLVLNGAPHADSVAATILIRFTTLWFAVALGIVSILAGRRALNVAQPA